MILQDALEKHGYAQLLIADYHLEYPLKASHDQTRVQLVWNPFEVGELAYGLNPEQDAHSTDERIEAFAAGLFGPLEKLYGHHYETGMNLWKVQGGISQLCGVFDNLAQSLMGGSSGDDDTFDYWPNAFEMLMEMANDILTLMSSKGMHSTWILRQAERVVTSAIAINGPLDTWEAEDVQKDLDALKARMEVVSGTE